MTGTIYINNGILDIVHNLIRISGRLTCKVSPWLGCRIYTHNIPIKNQKTHYTNMVVMMNDFFKMKREKKWYQRVYATIEHEVPGETVYKHTFYVDSMIVHSFSKKDNAIVYDYGCMGVPIEIEKVNNQWVRDEQVISPEQQVKFNHIETLFTT